MKKVYKMLKEDLFGFKSSQSDLNIPAILKEKSNQLSTKLINNNMVNNNYNDPLLIRINQRRIQYMEYYYKRSFYEILIIRLNNVLCYLKITKPKLLLYRKLQNDQMIPHYSQIGNKKHFFTKGNVAFMLIVLFYLAGYIYCRCLHDNYIKRHLYSKYHNFNNLVLSFNKILEKIDSKIEEYFPREYTSDKYRFLIHKYYNDWKTKREIKYKMKKLSYLNQDIMEFDSLIKKL